MQTETLHGGTCKEMPVLAVIRKMWQMSGAECLDPFQIGALRQARLGRLLRHVLTRSRFYREYYREHGITVDTLADVQLTDIPPINKDIVMANFDGLVCDPAITKAGIEQFLSEQPSPKARYKGRYHVTHTSGSTGSIGIFVYGQRDWDLMQALVGTRVLQYRPTIGRIRYAFLLKTDGHHGGVKLCQGAPWIAFKPLALSINAPLEQTLDEVQRFQPHLLGGYGSGLCLLAQEQRAGRIRIRPSRVISSGEPLTDAMARMIGDAFGLAPADLYAACESLALGISCRQHRGIHLFDDWHCFELVDHAGRPVGPGSRGRLILTNLYNYTQPLIRYEMNDEIIPAGDRCPCGRPFQLIERIAGRTEEILWFEKPDGTWEYLHPFAIAGLHVPGIEKWQVVQTGPNELLVRLKIAAGGEAAIRRAKDEIIGILRGKRLEPFITVRIETVDEIRNDPRTGKCRLVISYAHADRMVQGASPAQVDRHRAHSDTMADVRHPY